MIDLEEFIAANAACLALVVNLSGGKDSTRMLGYVRARFPDITDLLRHGRYRVRACAADPSGRVVSANRRSVRDGSARRAQPEQDVSGDGARPRQVPFGAISTVHQRPEAWSDPEDPSLIAASGARQLHGNARPGIDSACTAGVLVTRSNPKQSWPDRLQLASYLQ